MSEDNNKVANHLTLTQMFIISIITAFTGNEITLGRSVLHSQENFHMPKTKT